MKFDYPTIGVIMPDMHGLYRISHEAYHSGIGLSSSWLKRALISQAAYNLEERSDTSAFAFGRAFHAALVEPAVFMRDWVTMPEFDGHPNSNAYKTAKFDWVNANRGKQILDSESNATIKSLIKVVTDHPEYANLHKHEPEIMVITTIDGTLVKCKCDLLGHSIVDFKTTSSGITPGEFMHDIVKYRYHVSAAFYQDIVTAVIGVKPPFIVVPVTKKPPYDCEFYTLSDEVLEEGRKLYKVALRRIQKWEAEKTVEKKRMRVLQPNSRMINETRELIEFIEGT